MSDTYIKLLLVLTLLLGPGCGLFGADTSTATQAWVVTNAVGTHRPSGGYLGEYELTPSVSTNVPNSHAYYNSTARVFLRLRERTLMRAMASATYGGRIMADYEVRTDARAAGATNASEMTDKEAWQSGRTLLKASYFRGRVFYTASNSLSDEWITAFATADRKRIVIVHDSGPIYVSESTGSRWKAIARSGDYEFTLSTTPKGSALVAAVSLTNVLLTAAGNAPCAMTSKSWYSVASSADTSQLVLSGGPGQSAPALSIIRSESSVIVRWPAGFIGFVLQESSDLAGTNWVNITNRISVTDMQNEVALPIVEGRNFFRLVAREH